MEPRRIRSELIPYLKDARRQGNTAFIQKDKLMANKRRHYKLQYLKNFRMEYEAQIRESPISAEDKEMSGS
jgi:hypothetical protein